VPHTGDDGIKHTESGGYTVHATAQPADIQKLKTAGYQVKQNEDVDEHGKTRQQEVGKGDRYKQPPGRR
jgi:hypothetical protein